MSAPKFLFLAGNGAGEKSRPAWPGPAHPFLGQPASNGSWVAWRLIGGNHRELGRSAQVFADLAAARNAAVELRESAAVLVVALRAGSPGTGWHWRVSVNGVVTATSSRTFARQREALYNVEAFRAAAALAQLSEVVAGFRGAVPTPRPALEATAGTDLQPTTNDLAKEAS